MYVPLALQCIFGRSDEGSENGNGEKESEFPGGGERVVSCIQMTWCCVVSRRKT